MLVKRITKKGDAVPYTPEEALPFAIQYAAKKQNSHEKVFWVLKDTIAKGQFSSFVNQKDNTWEATATGTALVGWTEAKTDHFYKPKPYDFVVKYKSAKDDKGLPDIAIVSATLTPKDMNPRSLAVYPKLSVEAKAAEPKPGTPAAARKEAAAAPVPPKPEVVEKA